MRGPGAGVGAAFGRTVAMGGRGAFVADETIVVALGIGGGSLDADADALAAGSSSSS